MKLIVCAIGVLVVTGAISLAIAPVLSLAQPADPFSLLDRSNLTPRSEPTDHLIQMDDQAQLALKAILTPAQRKQLENDLERDGIRPTALTALNLSPNQQTELLQILMSVEQPPADVLTPEQIEQVRRSLPFQF
ncbi:MAG: hypothetical protein KME27_24040 [Lyngbya sp. HA4199-MV5]|jgi:hypothetical protein|nr:hypothetical protein [Lyngbya sp. HA4199-MV5]